MANAAVASLATLVAGASLSAACTGSDTPPDNAWTVRQAESIASVRGMPVSVKGCRGIDGGLRNSSPVRFSRFACVAGARLRSDRFDTVAVLYELHPLGEYDGSRSRYRLTNVRFLGGPGIP